jgi:hypothetical protein
MSYIALFSLYFKFTLSTRHKVCTTELGFKILTATYGLVSGKRLSHSDQITVHDHICISFDAT